MEMDIIRRVSIGSEPIDRLLNGGLECDTITTIYGPAGAGKTNLCLSAAIACARRGQRILYVDAEGGFSSERFLQLAPDGAELAKKILFIKPMVWVGQSKVFSRLDSAINDSFGIIIIDAITSLYRLELGKCGNGGAKQDVNRDFSQQLAVLNRIARQKKIPILLTSQVYSDFNRRDNVRLVGGDLLEYTSRCLVELRKTHDGFRRAILKKHRSLRENLEVIFEIGESGLDVVHNRRMKSPLVEETFDIDEDKK